MTDWIGRYFDLAAFPKPPLTANSLITNQFSEVLREGGGGDGQGLIAPRKIRQEAATKEQKHQDHLPTEEIPVPQRGQEMLAPRKTCPARLRILSDVC